MQLYDKNGLYAEECDIFLDLINNYPQLKFFQPSPSKAPWHVQAIVDSDAGREGELNFWPHKLKVSYHGPSEQGAQAIRDTIERALEDIKSSERGDFDVIEG